MLRRYLTDIAEERKVSTTRTILSQFVGIVFFFFIYTSNLPMELQAKNFLAVFSFVVLQWLFSSTPLFISGLMGVALTVLLGIVPFPQAFKSFSSPIIFLFLGGFLLARAMEKLGLDRKISVFILSSKYINGSFKKTFAVTLIITAFFSMWVSNSATTAMMIPIALGILKSFKIKEDSTKNLFLLSVAYAATIGGLGTPIGSPPNLITIGLLDSLAGHSLNFWDWCKYGIPMMLIFLVILYLYSMSQIKENIKVIEDDKIIDDIEGRNKLTINEIRLIIIFLTTIALWFAPSIVELALGKSHEFSIFISKTFTTSMVAILAACALFMFPIYRRTKILDPEDIKRIDWGTLLLFASGLSLGGTLFETGLAVKAGNYLLTTFSTLSFSSLLIIIVGLTIITTELISNTAAANILIPILIASSKISGFSPVVASLSVAFACNFAFMLPVATPPNAIVYGTGLVPMKSMIKYGAILNLLGFIFISIIVKLF